MKDTKPKSMPVINASLCKCGAIFEDVTEVKAFMVDESKIAYGVYRCHACGTEGEGGFIKTDCPNHDGWLPSALFGIKIDDSGSFAKLDHIWDEYVSAYPECDNFEHKRTFMASATKLLTMLHAAVSGNLNNLRAALVPLSRLQKEAMDFSAKMAVIEMGEEAAKKMMGKEGKDPQPRSITPGGISDGFPA
jgi:hypothetical protein